MKLSRAKLLAVAARARYEPCRKGIAHLPEGAQSFTTIELKSNHLGTVKEGCIACHATAQHLGRNTQVWDAVVTDEASGKKIALFRCTQMILWPKA